MASFIRELNDQETCDGCGLFSHCMLEKTKYCPELDHRELLQLVYERKVTAAYISELQGKVADLKVRNDQMFEKLDHATSCIEYLLNEEEKGEAKLIKQIAECDLCEADGIPIKDIVRDVNVEISWKVSEDMCERSNTHLGDLCQDCFASVKDYLKGLREIDEDINDPTDVVSSLLPPGYSVYPGYAGEPS